METTVKQRLVKFIEHLDISQGKFEKLCNLSNGYINNIKKTIGVEKIDEICTQFPELNREWLLYNRGEMLNPTERPQNDTIEIECPNCGETIDVCSEAIIPLIPQEVAKRPDINLDKWMDNHPQEMKRIDLTQLWGDDVFLMRVDTRAMEPEYKEGTFLVLRKLPDLSFARADGSPYVVDTMRPHTLFRNLTAEYDGTYTLSAENDRRSAIKLHENDIINVYDIVGSFRIGR